MSEKNRSRAEAFGRRFDDALVPTGKNADDVLRLPYEEFHNLIYQDELTGLLNRRGFMKNLLALKEGRSPDEPDQFLAIGMLDVDSFKAVNDTYGHDAGDVTLKDIVGIISSCLRDGDILARWGGDEFAVAMLLHHSFDETKSDDVANGLSWEIQKRLKAAIKDGKNAPLGLTGGVSLGVEICLLSGLGDVRGIIDKADSKMMYNKEHESRAPVSSRRVAAKAGRVAVVGSSRRVEDKTLTHAESA